MRQGPVAAGERRDTSSARLAAEPPFSSAGPRRQPSNLLLTRLGQQQSDGSGHSQPTEMKGESGALPSHSGSAWAGAQPPPARGTREGGAGEGKGRGRPRGQARPVRLWGAGRSPVPQPGRGTTRRRQEGSSGRWEPSARPCPARPAPRLRSARPPPRGAVGRGPQR